MLLDDNHEKVGHFQPVPASDDKCKQKVWDGCVDDVRVCQVHRFDEWGLGRDLKITVDCSFDAQRRLDRRLVLSAVLVKMALEVEQMNQG